MTFENLIPGLDDHVVRELPEETAEAWMVFKTRAESLAEMLTELMPPGREREEAIGGLVHTATLVSSTMSQIHQDGG